MTNWLFFTFGYIVGIAMTFFSLWLTSKKSSPSKPRLRIWR